jgi:hypothetical protein
VQLECDEVSWDAREYRHSCRHQSRKNKQLSSAARAEEVHPAARKSCPWLWKWGAMKRIRNSLEREDGPLVNVKEYDRE